jgi:hypothetical protein
VIADWEVHPLAADVVVRLAGDMLPLPAAAEADVERTWQEALGKYPKLFNGRVLTVEEIEPRRITVRWTEYRRVGAQLREPALFDALRIRPLAVCGPLVCADGVVFGRREAGAVYLPGYWQVPPAGNVDARAVDGEVVDFRASLLEELHEELGIPADAVDRPRPVCAVEHPGTHVVDIACLFETTLDAAGVHEAHARAQDRELDLLRIVPPEALGAALGEMAPKLMGVAPASLRAAGLLQ